jgi:hypothetical protein
MQPISNYQTPPLAILGQKSNDWFKNTILIQNKKKKKNTPHFCLKRTKGKIE